MKHTGAHPEAFEELFHYKYVWSLSLKVSCRDSHCSGDGVADVASKLNLHEFVKWNADEPKQATSEKKISTREFICVS